MFTKLPQKLFLLFSALVTLNVQANEPIPSFPSKLASQSLLTDVTKVGNKLIAVGERGHIIISSDGDNWQQAQVPVNVLLTAVDFKNEKVGFATGHDATLLKTIDGGLTWSIINYQPELDKPFLDVKADKTNIVAVGAYGLFMQSIDGGDEWQTKFHDELLIEDDRLYLEDLKEYEPEAYDSEKQFMLPHFNSINSISGELIMVGEAGFLAISSDQGETWQPIETDYFGSYFSINGSGPELYLAGLRGNLFKSNDSGLQWQQIQTPVPATINNSYQEQLATYFFANSGNVFLQQGDNELQHHILPDGKAVMAGVVFKEKLILATESGIKSLPLTSIFE